MWEISDNVMDIAQNSVVAGASLITVEVRESLPEDTLSVSVSDNGCGMTPEQVEHVIDPFYTTRTTRSVGLGVPLFKMEAEMTGGSFSIVSEKNVGTATTAVFKPSSIDMTPLGDINGAVRQLILLNPQLDFVYNRSLQTVAGELREFSLKTTELREALGGEVELNDPDVQAWIREFLDEQTRELLGEGPQGGGDESV